MKKLIGFFSKRLASLAGHDLFKRGPIRNIYSGLISRITAFVVKHPKLQVRITIWLQHHPALYSRLRREVLGRGGAYKKRKRPMRTIDAGAEHAEIESRIIKASKKWNLGRRIDG